MSITHEQARKLIQSNMDRNLSVEESAKLSIHLYSCSACTAYASEIKAVAKILPGLMTQQWDAQPVPLSISTLLEKHEKRQVSTFLTMRKAAITFVVMALFFSAWQFVLSGPLPSSRLPSAIPPVPTPSSPTMQTVSTQLTLEEGCAIMSYNVQTGDTLASIAEQFLTSEDMIMEFNHLEISMVSPAMELIIPVCNFTPTGTFHPATLTTTYTPRAKPTTSTPGG
jgi:predicted anti-sigma-YlaC factor YlaD